MKIIRTAVPDDAEQLLAIYAPYVKKTAITFEYEVPSPKEFRERIEHTLTRYPYLVAEEDGNILGYAYAGPLKERAAYDWSVEVSVYVEETHRGGGLGRALYEALEEALREKGICNLYACIASPVVPDEYLTDDSERYHARMGYAPIGRFHKCGYKFGRWYDMIWMEKMIGEHPENEKKQRGTA